MNTICIGINADSQKKLNNTRITVVMSILYLFDILIIYLAVFCTLFAVSLAKSYYVLCIVYMHLYLCYIIVPSGSSRVVPVMPLFYLLVLFNAADIVSSLRVYTI